MARTKTHASTLALNGPRSVLQGLIFAALTFLSVQLNEASNLKNNDETRGSAKPVSWGLFYRDDTWQDML